MVNVRRDDNSKSVNVTTSSNSKTVQGCNDLSKYYAEQSLSYSNDSKDYAEIAQTAASNAQISAGSAEQSANTCTAVLNNTHFQTVYTDLESENSDIETVSDNIENVNAVSTNIESVNTNATNITAITTNATNITAIQNASSNAQTCIDNATIATQKATLASGSATSASNSATNANIWAEGTDEQVQALGGVHSSKGWADVASVGQQQADCAETDNTKVTFVKGKNLSNFNNDCNLIQNTATGTGSLTIENGNAADGRCSINIGSGSYTSNDYNTALGCNSTASNGYSTALGYNSTASNGYSIALGYHSTASKNSAIQLGYGNNNTAKTFSVGFYDSSTPTNYQLLDGTTGLIPDARLSSNIEKTVNKDVANGYCGLNASGKIDVANRIADGAIATSKLGSDVIDLIDSSNRNLGEDVSSDVPLTDAGLHLKDGALIDGSGIYSDFIDYMEDLYENAPMTTPNILASSSSISGSILSGTGTADFQCSAYTNFTLEFKTHTPSTMPNEFRVLASFGTEQIKGLVVGLNADYTLHFNISTDGSTWKYNPHFSSQLTLNADTDYYIRLTYNGSTYSIKVSTDGRIYTDYGTISDELFYTTGINNTIRFGFWYNAGVQQYVYSGSYDLQYCKFTTTVNNQNVTLWQGMTKDGFYTEQEFQKSVTDYGCCGCYVVDTTNHTVRLPKVTDDNGRYLIKAYTSNGITCRIYSDGWCEQSGVDYQSYDSYINFLVPFADTNYDIQLTSGNGNYATLPSVGSDKQTNKFMVIKVNSTTAQGVTAMTLWKATGYITLPTQTPAKKYNYVCVATSVKQPAIVEIDNVITDLNGKADIDLSNSNPSQTFINNSMDWGMPDYSSVIDISSSVDTTSTQNRSYSYPIMVYFMATSSWVSGYSITVEIDGTKYGNCNHSYSACPTTLTIPANTNFKAYVEGGMPDVHKIVRIIPMKGA